MRKKTIIFSLAMAALIPFSGCGSNSQTASSENKSDSSSAKSANNEYVECLYVVPGDAPKDIEGGQKAINEKMASDGVGVQVKFKYIPWDAWDQKINIMLSTGEEFDLFPVMNDRVSLSNYVSRNALADITDLIDKYGENIKKVNPEIMMKSAQVKGKQYAIPAYWVESALDPEVTIRTDILKKYGINEIPKTFEELTEDFEKIMKEWDGAQKPYYPMIGSSSSRFGIADKTYDSWPFVIYDKIFFVDQNGNVKNYFETEEFKKSCENARIWYEKGLISPDVLTTTSDQLNNQLNSGDWFVHGGTIGSIEPLKTNYPDITVDDFVSLDLAPEKPRVRPYGTRNMNAVPLSSKHPEAAVKMINWIYANQDNYDLFLYGREGVDFNKADDHRRVDLLDSTTNSTPYSFADWMIGNKTYLRPSTTTPKATVDSLYSENKTAVEGYAAQFTFDPTNVQTQYTDVQTVISSAICPIACGVQDYESHIKDALSQLKAAGVDELIKEFQRQLEESKK